MQTKLKWVGKLAIVNNKKLKNDQMILRKQ